MQPGQVDVQLSALMTDIARDVGESATEGVSVSVARSGRFRNRAWTRSGLSLDIDEPVSFGGTGESPDPAEYLLAAAGASLSVTITAMAALRGLVVDAIEISLDAQIHGNSFFQPRVGKRPGLLDVRLQLVLTSPMSSLAAKALLAEAVLASPVLRSLNRRPLVKLQLKRRA
jgi:uncharacterized OsmC-like protein